MIEKEAGDFEAVEDFVCRVSLSLTQEETMRFLDNEDILIQLNVIGTSGARVTSDPIVLKCGPQYHRVVI